MDTKALDSLISQLQQSAALAGGKGIKPAATQSAGGFGELLKSSLDQVNSAQNNAQELARAYEMGSPGASLHDVMIASSKANIAFQATVQVRNKLVSAYHDIMNMQL